MFLEAAMYVVFFVDPSAGLQACVKPGIEVRLATLMLWFRLLRTTTPLPPIDAEQEQIVHAMFS
jgi:hypothetical protein